MRRCNQRERMEDPTLSGEELHEALRSMDRFHKLLGTLRLVERAIDPLVGQLDRPLKVCDIGAGTGYLGERLHHQHGDAIHYVRVEPTRRIFEVFPPRPWETVIQARCPGLSLLDGSVDVVVSSLVLHHIPDDTLESYLRESRSLASRIVIHHDLVRSPIAYGLTWLFTRLFSGSPVARSDGPLSVRRSRTQREWRQFLETNQLGFYRVEGQWPWRVNLRWEAEPANE